MKDVLFELALLFFFLMKMEQAISGTSAATYKVMEPHYIFNTGNLNHWTHCDCWKHEAEQSWRTGEQKSDSADLNNGH